MQDCGCDEWFHRPTSRISQGTPYLILLNVGTLSQFNALFVLPFLCSLVSVSRRMFHLSHVCALQESTGLWLWPRRLQWHLWQIIKWHVGTYFYEYFGFLISLTIPPVFCTHEVCDRPEEPAVYSFWGFISQKWRTSAVVMLRFTPSWCLS